MIRIDMIRQDTRHPDKRRRHQGRAICEVVGQRFEAQGPAPVYKLATLLWLHGHGGADFEVWDDRSPTCKPGGLAQRGKVRNWARLVNGKPKFDRKAPPDPDFKPSERGVIAQAAERLVGKRQSVPPRGDNARTGAIWLSDGLDGPREEDRASTRFSTAHAPEAA
jgi:hypothetical protein